MRAIRHLCLTLGLLVAALPLPAAASGLDSALQSIVSVLPVMPPERYRAEEPEGSGIVVHDGGYILTAQHVVDGADAIFVRSSDGDVIEARLHGVDPYTDLAVLALDTAMKPARFGGDPALGDRVCAVGNAFGLDLSVSCGVVSGVHRAGVGFNRIEDFVQTDAAVNPGASGGALLNEAGEVVGILSAIFTQQSDANIGINFAVAAPLAARVMAAIIDEGGFRPIQAGLTLERDPPAGAPGRLAALVVGVAANSPGERAGLREGDRILRAGDRRVRKPADLISALARLSGDAEIPVQLERAGRVLELRLSAVAGTVGSGATNPNGQREERQ